jgi:hypothetical protein
MKQRWIATLLLGAVATFTFSDPAAALGTKIYSVPMDGSQEVPVVATSGTGLCTVILDDVTGFVQVSGSFSGLTSGATLAHIHGLAPPGMNAGILVTLTETGGTSGTVSGSGTLSPANLAGLLAGDCYLNIHTSMHSGGEIRGQIVTEVPSMSWGWLGGLVAAILLGGAFVMTRRPAVSLA